MSVVIKIRSILERIFLYFRSERHMANATSKLMMKKLVNFSLFSSSILSTKKTKRKYV